MSCCASDGNEPCCKVESVVTIDERGQMVLPKDIRDRAGIKAGDKLAVVSWKQESGIACLALIKADKLNDMVREMLGPIFKDAIK